MALNRIKVAIGRRIFVAWMAEKHCCRARAMARRPRVSPLLAAMMAAAGLTLIDTTIAPRAANAQVITACTSVAGSTNLNLSSTLSLIYGCYNGAGAGGALGAFLQQ